MSQKNKIEFDNIKSLYEYVLNTSAIKNEIFELIFSYLLKIDENLLNIESSDINLWVSDNLNNQFDVEIRLISKDRNRCHVYLNFSFNKSILELYIGQSGYPAYEGWEKLYKPKIMNELIFNLDSLFKYPIEEICFYYTNNNHKSQCFSIRNNEKLLFFSEQDYLFQFNKKIAEEKKTIYDAWIDT